jgi:hypothetical protein
MYISRRILREVLFIMKYIESHILCLIVCLNCDFYKINKIEWIFFYFIQDCYSFRLKKNKNTYVKTINAEVRKKYAKKKQNKYFLLSN